VLADHGEQIAEQRPVVGGQVLGDVVDRCRRAVGVLGSNLDMAAAIGRGRAPAVGS